MKLGIAGQLPQLDTPRSVLLPSDWRAIQVEDCLKVRRAGFRGASLFINRPLEATPEDVQRVKACFDAAELEIAQLNGWYETLCNFDADRRRSGIAGMVALVRIGAQVSAPSVYVRPGGHNPNGHWFAHPENHSPRTFDLIVDSLRQVMRVAETEGVPVAVEGHVLSALDTPQRVRDLLDAVGSPMLKFNFDPVNFIGTVQDAHHTTRVVDALAALMEREIIVAHAKDCRIADALVLHIEEVVPGTGTLDYAAFMRHFQRLCPDGYFIIEHLPDELVEQAQRNVVALAQQYDIPLET